VYGALDTSGVALVSAATSADLPTLVTPTMATWPAPSRTMRKAESWRVVFFSRPGPSFKLGELLAQVGPQVVGAFVLGDQADELVEGGDLVFERLGFAIALFGLKGIGWEVGRHGCNLSPTVGPRAALAATRRRAPSARMKAAARAA